MSAIKHPNIVQSSDVRVTPPKAWLKDHLVLKHCSHGICQACRPSTNGFGILMLLAVILEAFCKLVKMLIELDSRMKTQRSGVTPDTRSLSSSCSEIV